MTSNEERRVKTLSIVDEDGMKISVDVPWDASMEDMCHAFATLCIGLTFMPSTVYGGMKEYAETYGPDEDETTVTEY